MRRVPLGAAAVFLLAVQSALYVLGGGLLRVPAHARSDSIGSRSTGNVPTIVSVAVINLPQSTERWARFRQNYAAHPLPNIPVSDLHQLEAVDPRLTERFEWRTKYENGIVGCALSHIKALRRIAGGKADGSGVRSNATASGNATAAEGSNGMNIPEDLRWHLILEDDAAGNFTALADLLEKRRGIGRRVAAINLFSPRLVWKYKLAAWWARLRGESTVCGSSATLSSYDVPAPGFGTRMTAYVVTAEGARWMLSVLAPLEVLARNVMNGTPLGTAATIGDRPADIIPVDVVMSRSAGAWWRAVSYRGRAESCVTGGIGPSGDASTYAAGIVRPGAGKRGRRLRRAE